MKTKKIKKLSIKTILKHFSFCLDLASDWGGMYHGMDEVEFSHKIATARRAYQSLKENYK